jgi:putative hydroxymethylpyrimidine transport system ATP-binding protein
VHLPETKPDRGPSVTGLCVENMQLGWDSKILVDGLSFAAPARSWTCLLGESGVGKSTLLRTLAGLLPPLPGTKFTGTDDRPVEGRIAYMAQQDLLLPWLTAADNVALGARLRGETPDLGKVSELLARTGIADRRTAKPGELSGGERQRVALARTLIEERPIVLMDEPFSALDAITRTQLQDLAFELLVDRTVVMVTHDPFEALRLGASVHIIRNGQNLGQEPLIPPGVPLRDPTDPSLRDTYHAIMTSLSQRGGLRPGASARW